VSDAAGLTTPRLDASRRGSGFGSALVACVLSLPLLFELYVGGVLVYGMIVPLPPAWFGLLLSLVFGVAGPVTTLLVWRTKRNRALPRLSRLRRAEMIGLAVGVPSILVLFVIIAVTTII
jgi:hypothetical protein